MKTIAAMFKTRSEGEGAIRALLDHGIPAERIGMVAGDSRAEAKQTEAVGADEAAGAVAGGGAAGIAGLTALAIPAVGTALLAGAAAALGVAGAEGAQEQSADAQLRNVLLRAGLTEEQVPLYADDVRAGRTVVVVNADDQETDLIHTLFLRHGSSSIEFRRRA